MASNPLPQSSDCLNTFINYTGKDNLLKEDETIQEVILEITSYASHQVKWVKWSQ